MGADCIINNLHFHVLKADRLFGPDTVDAFPIELADKQLFFKTNLKHKSPDEINMYNIGVRFGEVQGWPLQSLIISPDIGDEEASLEDAQEALAHAAGVVINHLINENIPHNVLFADEGMTVYLIPRKFDLLIEGVQFFTSFETLCGMIKFKNEAAYQSASALAIADQLANQVSFSPAEFKKLKQDIVNKFMTEYSGEVMATDLDIITEQTQKLKL